MLEASCLRNGMVPFPAWIKSKRMNLLKHDLCSGGGRGEAARGGLFPSFTRLFSCKIRKQKQNGGQDKEVQAWAMGTHKGMKGKLQSIQGAQIENYRSVRLWDYLCPSSQQLWTPASNSWAGWNSRAKIFLAPPHSLFIKKKKMLITTLQSAREFGL